MRRAAEAGQVAQRPRCPDAGLRRMKGPRRPGPHFGPCSVLRIGNREGAERAMGILGKLVRPSYEIN